MEAVKRYGILTVGSVVLGISDYMFKFQNHFSFGGVSGIAVIMSGLLGGSASTYTFVINMLLLVVAFVLLGKEVAMRCLCERLVQCNTGSHTVCVADVKATYKSAGVGTCILLYDPCSMFRNFLQHECIQRWIGYYCFDIKKVYQCFNRNSTAGRRFHSYHCGIFRVWCNCRFIFTGRIPCKVIFY